jgi:ferredoxin
MPYAATIDAAACAAHGDCEAIAPEIFAIDDRVCPSVAIVVVDEDTGEQVYP